MWLRMGKIITTSLLGVWNRNDPGSNRNQFYRPCSFHDMHINGVNSALLCLRVQSNLVNVLSVWPFGWITDISRPVEPASALAPWSPRRRPERREISVQPDEAVFNGPTTLKLAIEA